MCSLSVPAGDTDLTEVPESVVSQVVEPAFVPDRPLDGPFEGWWRGWGVIEWNSEVAFRRPRDQDLFPRLPPEPGRPEILPSDLGYAEELFNRVTHSGSWRSTTPEPLPPLAFRVRPQRVPDPRCDPAILCPDRATCPPTLVLGCGVRDAPAWVGHGRTFVSDERMSPSSVSGLRFSPGATGSTATFADAAVAAAASAPALRGGTSMSFGGHANAFGVGASTTFGNSQNDLDFFDFDGDRRPDSVRLGQVVFQERPAIRPASEDPVVFRARNRIFEKWPGFDMRFGTLRSVQSLDASVSFPTTPRSSTPSAQGSKPGAGGLPWQLNASMPSAGARRGGSITSVEWLDINGDGLPDHVRTRRVVGGVGGGRPTLLLDYQLNLGHRLGVPSTMVLAEDPPLLGPSLRQETTRSDSAQFSFGPVGAGPARSTVDTTEDMVDLNGDGLPDHVRRDCGRRTMRVRFNLGERFGPETDWAAQPWPGAVSVPGVPFPPGAPPAAVDDVCLTAPGAATWDVLGHIPGGSLAVSVGGSFKAPIGPLGCLFVEAGANVQGSDRAAQLQFEDIDGDGRIDHVLREGSFVPGVSAAVQVRHNDTGRANMLSHVDLPLGGSFDITYARQGNRVLTGTDRDTTTIPGRSLRVDMPRNHWVLSQVTVSDGRPDLARQNTYTQRFDYHNSAFHDREEREDYGFARVTVVRLAPDPSSDSGFRTDSTVDTFYHNQDYWRRGLAFRTEERDAAGHIFRAHETSYAAPRAIVPPGCTAPDCVGPRVGSFFPADLESRAFQYDGTTDTAASFRMRSVTTRAYDPVTNLLVTSHDNGNDEDPADDVEYTIRYDPALLTAGIARAIEIKAHSTLPGGGDRLLRQRTATYDSQGSLLTMTDRLDGGRDPAGAPYTGASNPTWTFTHDNFGNIDSATDPGGYRLLYSYRDETRTYRTNIVDNFPGGGYRSNTDYDVRFGVATRIVDENGQRERREYDAFGRLVRLWGPNEPDGSTPTVEYVYDLGASSPSYPLWAQTRHYDSQHPGDTLDTVVFVDGLGRAIQTRRDAQVETGGVLQTGVTLSGAVHFDHRGRVISMGQPAFSTLVGTAWFEAPDVNATLTQYDSLSRPTRVETPDHAVTTTVYAFAPVAAGGALRATTTVTDPLLRERTVYRDARDQTVAVLEHNRVLPDGEADVRRTVPRDLLTRYTYDPIGQLTQVTDARGNPHDAEYDSLGQMVSLTTRDTGTTEYRFDLSGNLGARITPNLRAMPAPPPGGHRVRYTYDFNRLRQIDYPTSTSVVLAYGAPGAPANAAGRLSRRIDSSGTIEFEYGAMGETSVVRRTLVGGTSFGLPVSVTTRFAHDSFGRMLSMQYPDGEEVSYGYNLGGQLESVTGTRAGSGSPIMTDYVRAIRYDEFGSRTRMTYGNGVTTQYAYDPVMRRLAQLDSTMPTGAALQALAYTYNRVGNIIAMRNGPVTQGFAYDDLDQLSTALGYYSRALSTGGVPLPVLQRYEQGLGYDEIGNLRRNVQADSIQYGRAAARPRTDTSHDLTYRYAAAHPHAPECVGNRHFDYL